MVPTSMPPITNKRQMYDMLSNGLLGNSTEQFFSLDTWKASPDYGRYPLWGVRTTVAGGGPSRLNVPRTRVERFADDFPEYRHSLNISPMIDQWALLRCELIDLTGYGLSLTYVDPEADLDPWHPWRDGFRNHARHVRGSAALAVLRAYLWPSDFDEMMVRLDTYPDHTVEFTACDRAVGRVPVRNTVIWEVRKF